jgi:hypothetical protein
LYLSYSNTASNSLIWWLAREWFLVLTRQLHKTRAIGTGGVLKQYLRELEQEPKDLIRQEKIGEFDEGYLYFSGKQGDKKHKLLQEVLQ